MIFAGQGKGKRKEEVSAMSVRKPRRSAFTLVELLVVVVIIGMLVGLLMPAIYNARQSAIRTKCINYQGELGKGILLYENAKQRYPGYANQLTGASFGNRPVDVSWVVVVLEYLGRNDLWERWRANDIPSPLPTVAQLACPADSQILLARRDALSYMANPRIFRNRGQSAFLPANSGKSAYKAVSPSDIKSLQQTVLLAEKPFMRDPFDKSLGPGPWGTTDPPLSNNEPALVKNQVCFFWDQDAANNPPWWKDAPTEVELNKDPQQFKPLAMPISEILGSHHPGGLVVVTFCDGRTDAILGTAACGEFFWGPPVVKQ
jgi:prepilin-type N-terminal cleavage/methylation domain-containing protein